MKWRNTDSSDFLGGLAVRSVYGSSVAETVSLRPQTWLEVPHLTNKTVGCCACIRTKPIINTLFTKRMWVLKSVFLPLCGRFPCYLRQAVIFGCTREGEWSPSLNWGINVSSFLVNSLPLSFTAGAASHVFRFPQFPHWVGLEEQSQGMLLTRGNLAPWLGNCFSERLPCCCLTSWKPCSA